MITRCTYCGKPLALHKTAFASRDGMYCTYSCGVEHAKTKYAENEYSDEAELTAKAESYFDDISEEISREDYGAWTCIVVRAAAGYSFVFEEAYENDTPVSEQLLGYYVGLPDEPLADKELMLVRTIVN